MQPNPITEAGFFNCVIECIAGGDSCVLTGSRFHPKPTCGQHDVRRADVIEAQFGDNAPTRCLLDDFLPTVYLIVFNSDI